MFVPFFMCSQEEQYFINGKLPDFHQVDIPDMWIGLSGPLWFRARENVKKTFYTRLMRKLSKI